MSGSSNKGDGVRLLTPMVEKEGFYERHFFLIWIATGAISTLAIVAAQGGLGPGENVWWFVLMLIITYPILGIVWYVVFVMVESALSVFWAGVKETDPGGFILALWILVGVASFLKSAFFNEPPS